MLQLTSPPQAAAQPHDKYRRRALSIALTSTAVSFGALAFPLHAQGNEDELFATTHVLVRVEAGYEARQDANGDWIFAQSVQPNEKANPIGGAARQIVTELDALSRIMRGVGVTNIVRPLPFMPAHPDTAAAVGLDRWWRIDIPEGDRKSVV